MKKIISILLLIMTTLLTLSGCDIGYNYVEGKVNVVATTTMLGDLTYQIGGEKVALTTLMKTGVDPHLYTPKASDTHALERADFIVFNGLHLEGKLVSVLETLSQEKAFLNAGEVLIENQVPLIYVDQHNYDPHIWFDVNNWIYVAKGLAEKLIEYDQDNQAYYLNRLNIYLKKLNDLETFIHQRVGELPLDDRILITAHDAFSYFGRAYSFEVLAIQGISTEGEASISSINNLVNLVMEKGVKSIFIESSIPYKTIEAVINSAQNKGYDLQIGGQLYSDSLGDGDNATYINAFKHNVNTIVDALL